jgi:hypothetical protein
VAGGIGYHQHPDSFVGYLKKKFKFAFWRVLAVRKNPRKAIKDSHTPQLMKLQLLFGPAAIACLALDLYLRPTVPISVVVLGLFLVSTIPFTLRSGARDPAVGVISPMVLAARSCSQLFGVVAGVLKARNRHI